MPVRLIDPALPRASELPDAPSAAPARPASEDAGQSRAIIPGDDPGDQQPPKSNAFAIEAHITTTTTAVK